MADRYEVATLNLTVTGDTSDIEAKINALAEKLKAPLTEAMNKVNAAINSTEFKKAEKQIQDVQNTVKKSYADIEKNNSSLGESFVKLGKKILSIYGIVKLIKGITSLVNVASDAYESANLFYVSFGYSIDKTDDGISDLTAKANAFAKALENAWGIPSRQIRATIGSFNLFAKSMGMTTQQSYTLSTQLTQMAVEIASLRNISLDEAINKIKAGLAGNSRPLRDIGIATNEANLALIAYKYGLAEVGKELTAQQKILARYLSIREAVTKTGDIGNFSRTIGSLETQLKLLKSRSEELKVVWGTALMPAAKQVVYFLNSMVNVLMVLGKSFQSFMAKISGKTLQEMSIEFQAAADAAKATSNGTGSIADDLAEADESMQNLLAGFDKFNVLQDEGVGVKVDLSDFDLSKFKLDLPETALAEPVEKMTDAILKFLGYVKNVKETTDELGNTIKEVSYAWGGWENISPILKAIIASIKILISLKLASWITNLVPVIQNLAVQMKLASMQAQTLGASIQSLSKVMLVGLIYGIMTLIQNWDKLSSIQKIVYSTLLAIVGAIYLYSSGMGLAIAQTIKFASVALVNLVKTLLTKVIPAFIKTNASMLSVLGAIGAIVAVFTLLSNYWDDMGAWQKAIGVIGGLAAVVSALAIAIMSVQGALTLGSAIPFIIAGIAGAAATITSAVTAAKGIKFADGGLVYGETHAIVGEYSGAKSNPEVIAPLSDLNGIVINSFKKAIAEGNLSFQNSQNQQNTASFEATLVLDGRQLGKVFIPYINQGQTQTNIRIKR